MKRTLLFSSLFFIMVNAVGFAQAPVKVFRDKDGKLYSASQRDSILALGFPIGEISVSKRGDTSYIAIEIHPKADPSGTAFAQRHRDNMLPDFQLRTLEGKVIDSKYLQGKVVMINFWSTTCAPCIKEMPGLNQLKKRYGEVVFLAPAPENAATVKQFLARHPFEFIILPDAKELFGEWGVDGYPKNFFVDRKGVIREVREGTPFYRETEKDEWRVAVERTYSPILGDLIKRQE